MNERTPLTHHLNRNGIINNFSGPAVHEHVSNHARGIELKFGPWPSRLINHNWWWWQLEPIVCCHCLDESDDDTLD
ncbi:hypothetical protein CPB84DRAFT_1759766 [Gymnopilus junonius]|uniref:Uncharacterized protein n=1 Tax=Gymnopilus junonius TaxID=109634 RepID=A0A9P5TTL8_GYMJU|nr:hypothetical protein CPB84DRAFT_1759766 [Gymnopilus junonius]